MQLHFEGPHPLPAALADPAHYGLVYWEASRPERGIYSCVVVRLRTVNDGWPALGGTRWLRSSGEGVIEGRIRALQEAAHLAVAMDSKNRLLRNAEARLGKTSDAWRARGKRFGWGGGKGVIWSPIESQHTTLDPERLMCHGRLLEFVGGDYIGSKDQGVGSAELKWIERATRYTIGGRCAVDTGDPTAFGVLAAISQVAKERRLIPDSVAPTADFVTGVVRPALDGLNVVVLGAGKVGLPLLSLLDRSGATCRVYDPELKLGDVDKCFENAQRLGAAVDSSHLMLLRRLASEGRIFEHEPDALLCEAGQILSPNGGNTNWLGEPVSPGGPSRAAFLAEANRRGATRWQAVVGAANAQTTQSSEHEIVSHLADGDIHFIHDTLISPGGVIAVSHELASEWRLDRVRRDAFEIVLENVSAAYRGARLLHEENAEGLLQACQILSQSEPLLAPLPPQRSHQLERMP